MVAAEYDWSDDGLTGIEMNLIREYEKISRPLDALAYTEEFDRLVKAAGLDDTVQDKHRAFTMLLNLRKRGRLPRLLPTE